MVADITGFIQPAVELNLSKAFREQKQSFQGPSSHAHPYTPSTRGPPLLGTKSPSCKHPKFTNSICPIPPPPYPAGIGSLYLQCGIARYPSVGCRYAYRGVPPTRTHVGSLPGVSRETLPQLVSCFANYGR